MSTPNVTPNPDTSSVDPAVLARIQALIAAHQAEQTAATPPPAPTGNLNMPPAPAPVTPPTPALQPGAPTPTPNTTPAATTLAAANPQSASQLLGSIGPQPTAPAATPATPPPGPVKQGLHDFLYGFGQAALKHVGLQTDAEKAQQAANISVAQQNADTNQGYKDIQGQLLSAQTNAATAQQQPMQIPDLPAFGGLAGKTLPTSVAVPLMQKVLGYQSAADIAAGRNQTTIDATALKYGPGSYLRNGVRSVNGRIIQYDKGTGEVLKDMGPDTALITGPMNANARARAMAAYRTFDTTDASGAPVTISGLDALQGGAAHTPYTQAKGIMSDKVGIQQYRDILDNKIAPNLAVLNDPAQRIAIAHTLAEVDKNPGAMQAMLTSGLQSGALSQQGAQLAAGILQGREFGAVARKYGGNMNGTEGLMNRIQSNQASPLNSVELNQQLIQNDRAFTDKAMSALGGLTSHNAGNKGGPPSITPSAPASATSVTAPNGKTYNFPDAASAAAFKAKAGIQ